MMGTATIQRIINWKMPPSAKAVLITLAHHHNDETGLCYPSIKTLTRETCLSRSTVIRAVAQLQTMGAIKQPTVGLRGNYHYTFSQDITSLTMRPVSQCDRSQTDTSSGITVQPVPVSPCDLKRSIKEIEHHESAASPQEDQVGPVFITKEGKDWRLTCNQMQKLTEVYSNPHVNVELPKASLWCEANPKKRKSDNRMFSFVSGWLDRNKPSAYTNDQKNEHIGFIERSITADEARELLEITYPQGISP